MSDLPRSVFITGVGSGIGCALAHAYLDRGTQVSGLSRRAPAELCTRRGFVFAACDLASPGQIEHAMRALFPHTGPHLAILNAGVLGAFGDLRGVERTDLEHTMAINVWANKTVIDALLERGGVEQIVAISSGAAVSGARGWSGYGISKAALNMLVRLYAAELPEVHFCALAPGLVETAMQDTLAEVPEDPRFPTLARLRASRGTASMPTPQQLAPRLVEAIERLPSVVASGDYVDLRTLGSVEQA